MTTKTISRARTTGIEWTEHTWNPILGCSVLTAGCTNCYAMRQASRNALMGNASYDGLTRETKGGPVWTGVMRQASPNQLGKPHRIKAPSTIFVNSMSDMFHADARDEWRDDAFDVMRSASRHVYQVLTKRPEVAVRYYAERPDLHDRPGIWIGTSVERADVAHRIDTLRQVPAAVRFLSVEPLLGKLGPVDLTGIHWVITGGESGPGCRPCPPDAVREVRDLCAEQGVAFFHKQWGTYASNPLCVEQGMSTAEAKRLDPDYGKDGTAIGKGGSLIDGVSHRAMPAAHSLNSPAVPSPSRALL